MLVGSGSGRVLCLRLVSYHLVMVATAFTLFGKLAWVFRWHLESWPWIWDRASFQLNHKLSDRVPMLGMIKERVMPKMLVG